MKEKIAAIITRYQDAIADYFNLEVPMEDDSGHMENFLENLKEEISDLFDKK
jgi:hypothetical protein